MPKIKSSGNKFVESLPGGNSVWEFNQSQKQILCKLCIITMDYSSSNIKYRAEQHINSGKHKAHLTISSAPKQSLLSFASSSNNSENLYFNDLSLAMLRSNIPLHKVENENFRSFLEKYTLKKTPSESTLRKNYLPKEYNRIVDSIKQKVEGKNIYLMVDEATDPQGRFIVAILIGVLDENPIQPYLFDLVQVTETNNVSISQIINNTMTSICNGQIKYDKLKLVVTDGASYMLKACRNLKMMYEDLIHVTCVAHGFQRIAELVRTQHPKIDLFISLMKKTLIKCSRRKKEFVDSTNLPLPPQPVITRWATWIDACFYYCQHFDIVKSFIYNLDHTESASISKLHELLQDEDIPQQLAFIDVNFKILSTTITKLQGQLSLVESIGLVDNVIADLKIEPYKSKLAQVLKNNPDYEKMKAFSQILSGNLVEGHFNPNVVSGMQYAPIVSADVERCFSKMGQLLSPQRQRLTCDSVKMHMIVAWNNDL